MRDAAFDIRGVIMKSIDGGLTWDSNLATPDVDEPSDYLAPADWFFPWSEKTFARYDAITSTRVSDGAGGFADHVVASGHIYPETLQSGGTRSVWHSPWLIRRSLDGGATWQTLDIYEHPTYDMVSVRGSNSVAVSSSGTIYAAEMAEQRVVKGNSTTVVKHWLVRKGLPATDGMVWSTVGDFADPAATTSERSNTYPSGVACVGADVYVVGGGGGTWVVRKSSNGGTTWSVVDSFRLTTKDNCHAFGIAADSQGNVFVAGLGIQTITSGRGNNVTTVTNQYWIVRKGTGGGAVWTTLDQFQYPGANAQARAVTVAPNGDVHVTGYVSSNPARWITRCRSAATGLWSTTDDFAHPVNPSTYGSGITTDPFGNVFSSGYAVESVSGFINNWLVRRRLAP